MIETCVQAEVLRAALKRNGIWFVDVFGNPTEFMHKSCFMRRNSFHPPADYLEFKIAQLSDGFFYLSVRERNKKKKQRFKPVSRHSTKLEADAAAKKLVSLGGKQWTR